MADTKCRMAMSSLQKVVTPIRSDEALSGEMKFHFAYIRIIYLLCGLIRISCTLISWRLSLPVIAVNGTSSAPPNKPQTWARASINASQLKLLPVPLPMPREQQTIAAILDGVEEAIERGRMETDMLKSLKASAADALLTGRVRVKLGGDS